MPSNPKIRSSKNAVHPLNEIPRKVIIEICKRLAFREYMGENDLTGDQWAQVFAEAIDGDFKKSMTDLPDVTKNSTFWSAKTIRHSTDVNSLNLFPIISGRNNIFKSFNLEKGFDPVSKPNESGEMILEIWNSRLKNAISNFADARECVLIRNPNMDDFILFEKKLHFFDPKKYTWEPNENDNLYGYDSEGINCFRWQNTAQFTIMETLPQNFIHFKIPKHNQRITLEEVLGVIGFTSKSITIKNVTMENEK